MRFKPRLKGERARRLEFECACWFDRWKARHADIAPFLEPADVLVYLMRGRNTTWTRIRVNLQDVPEDQRPSQEPLEVDYDP